MGRIMPLFVHLFGSYNCWNLCDRLATNENFWYTVLCIGNRFIYGSVLTYWMILAYHSEGWCFGERWPFFILLSLYRTSVRVVNYHVDFHIHFSLKSLSFSVLDTYVVITLCLSVYLCFICWVHHSTTDSSSQYINTIFLYFQMH